MARSHRYPSLKIGSQGESHDSTWDQLTGSAFHQQLHLQQLPSQGYRGSRMDSGQFFGWGFTKVTKAEKQHWIYLNVLAVEDEHPHIAMNCEQKGIRLLIDGLSRGTCRSCLRMTLAQRMVCLVAFNVLQGSRGFYKGLNMDCSTMFNWLFIIIFPMRPKYHCCWLDFWTGPPHRITCNEVLVTKSRRFPLMIDPQNQAMQFSLTIWARGFWVWKKIGSNKSGMNALHAWEPWFLSCSPPARWGSLDFIRVTSSFSLDAR